MPHSLSTQDATTPGGLLLVLAVLVPFVGVLAGMVFGGRGARRVALATLAGRLLAEAVAGTAERFDVFARLPQRRFPGGGALRAPLLMLAMTWYSLRDRLG